MSTLVRKHASSTASVMCHDITKTAVSFMLAGAAKRQSKPDDIAVVVLRYSNKRTSRYDDEESDEDED